MIEKNDNVLLLDGDEILIDNGWGLRKFAIQEYKARYVTSK